MSVDPSRALNTRWKYSGLNHRTSNWYFNYKLNLPKKKRKKSLNIKKLYYYIFKWMFEEFS